MATPHRRPPDRSGFEIAIFCALRIEFDAALAVFDGHWRDHGGEFAKVEGDNNIYWTGWIGSHNVVLVHMPAMGNTYAAIVAGALLPSFPRIRLSLLVGICGGVPGRTEDEMLLGDVVISTKIIHLDLGSRYADKLVLKDTYNDQAGRPNGEILAFLGQMQGKEGIRRLRTETVKYTQALLEREDFRDSYYPGVEDDRLYENGYRHRHHDQTCEICGKWEKDEDSVCEVALRASCSELRCDYGKLVSRKRLQNLAVSADLEAERPAKRARTEITSVIPKPQIHFGPVGSGNWVIKSESHRDSIDQEVVAYEMEGSGISHNLPTLVIKGVCDYANSHKNKDWQKYASATAAACMKAVLHAWPKVDRPIIVDHDLRERNSSYLQDQTQWSGQDPSDHHSPFRRTVNKQTMDSTSISRSNTLVLTQEPSDLGSLSTSIDERQKHIFESLRFDQIDSRQLIIKAAHAKTCRWLLHQAEYKDWLAVEKLPEHHGVLWIKGNPGTGKSTLMKFALNAAKKSMVGSVVISFFFNARGDDLEKSTTGMYRSLLYQLLDKLPDLQDILTPSLTTTANGSENIEWTIETLQTLFSHAIERLGQRSLVCFIDALDECDEDQIRQMVTFFENLGDQATQHENTVRICFSSRHYPYVSIRNGIEFVLEDQEGHRQDIANYLDSELKAGRSKLIDEIKAEILQRSSGIFLWVFLIIPILNKEYDRGRVHALKKRLGELPDTLDKLFSEILIRDTGNMEQLIVCLQMILFSRRPLKPEELYHAILVGAEPDSLVPFDPQIVDQETLKRFILDSSKGLAEITKVKVKTVQFIHESVRDHFLKGNGLEKLRSNLGGNFQGQSHDCLKRFCQEYTIASRDLLFTCPDFAEALESVTPMDFKTQPLYDSSSSLPPESVAAIRRQVSVQYPFLEYAAQNVLHHTNIAQEFEIEQSQFVESFSCRDWIRLHNFFERYKIRCYSKSAELLYILASEGLSQLIPIELARIETMDLPAGMGRYRHPLHAALAEGHKMAVRAFLKPGVRTSEQETPAHDWRVQMNHEAYEALIESLLVIDHEPIFSKGRFPTQWAVANGNLDMLKMLVNTGKVNISAFDPSGHTILTLAAMVGNEVMISFVLEMQQSLINKKDNSYGRTPFLWALSKGHEAVAKLIFETGLVDVQDSDNSSRSGFSYAAATGIKSLEMLLNSTPKELFDSKDSRGRSPLSHAAEAGNEAIVKLLLDTKSVEIDSKDSGGRSPLSHAAEAGHEAVAKLLLDTGLVEIDSLDRQQRSPMFYAARDGRDAVVNLFLKSRCRSTYSRDKSDSTPPGFRGRRIEHLLSMEQLPETRIVDFDTTDKYTDTPLVVAAEHGHISVVKLLVESERVNVDHRGFNGSTPLSYAAANGYQDIVEMLLETGLVDVNSKNTIGETPLHLATDNNSPNIVKLLLDSGQVDVNCVDNNNETPLDIAEKRGYGHIRNLLIDYMEKVEREHQAESLIHTDEELESNS